MENHQADRNSPQWQWEQQLIQAYYDYRYLKLLDPLYDEFQHWKEGDRTHEAITSFIHEVHRQMAELHNLFGNNRKWLLTLIQLDEDWFQKWLAAHPAPPGVEITPPLGEP
ncbi:MAG TPA: hypothetical protein VH186_13505 [Chloroflexia bacterium]|nr:hypothetical protein [Chloroflexia bacterium]